MKTPSLLLALPGFTALLAAQSLQAQTWDGGGAAGGALTWSTATNWNPDAAPVNTGTANVIMAGIIDFNPGPDLNANWDINSLSFDNTAGGFALQSTGGFTLTVGNILNSDTQTQNINHALTPKTGAVWNAAAGPLNINGPVGGSNGFTKQGNSILQLGGSAANTYTGTTTVSAGTLVLSKPVSVNAIAGNLIVGDSAGTDTLAYNTTSHQIADTAAVSLNSGAQFDLNSQTETVGAWISNSGSLTQIGTGSLTVATLTMNAATISTAGAGSLRLNGDYTGAVGGGSVLDASVHLGGGTRIFTVGNSADTVDLDMTRAVTSGNLTKAGAGLLRLAGANSHTSTVLSAGTLEVAHDSALGTSAFTINGGTLAAGDAPRTVANSFLVAGSFDFGGSFDLATAGATTLNVSPVITVAAGRNLTLGAAVGQTFTNTALTKAGDGTLTLSGSGINSYNGATAVNAGTLRLAKTGTNIGLNGGYTVGDGSGTDTLIVAGPGTNQISDTVVGTIASSGQMLVESSEAIGRTSINGGLVEISPSTVLTVTGSGLTMTGGTIEGDGTLILASNLATTASANTSLISSALDLNGATRSATVADGAAAVDLEISADVSNGGLSKTGAGTLRLSGTHDFTTGLSLAQGEIILASAAAVSTGAITITGGKLSAPGASLSLPNTTILSGDAELAGPAAMNFSGAVTLPAELRLHVSSPGGVEISGPIGQTGGSQSLTKSGAGTLTFSGTLSNLYDGLTWVRDGTLHLQKPAAHAAVRGHLAIGDGTGAAASAILRLAASDQIADTASVSLNGPDGFLHYLGATHERVRLLTLTGAGVDADFGTIVATDGIVTLPSPLSAFIEGHLDLDGSTAVNVADGAAAADLMIFAALRNGTLIKEGEGTLQLLTPAPASAASYQVEAGTLDAALTLAPSQNFVLNGGAFTGSLHNQGTFTFNGGAFAGTLTNAGETVINAPLTLAAGFTNDASVTINSTGTLITDGSGLVNDGSITLAGGMLAGSGALVNNSLLTGSGILAGSGGFTNQGLITQDGGNLRLSNSGTNTNSGNIDLERGRQFILQTSLQNAGTLDLDGGLVTGAGTLNNVSGGSLTGRGGISAPFNNAGGFLAHTAGTLNITSAFTNTGTLALDGLTASLNGGAITNNGTIQGRGTVGSGISNAQTIEASGGTLTLSGSVTNTGLLTAGAGAKLHVTGSFPVNAGTVSLTGGTFDTAAALNSTGQITGHGIVRTGGLTNNGSVTLTGGLSTVNGSVTNAIGRTFHVAHNPAVFTGAFVNHGIFKNTETTVTFTGTYTENGTYVSDPADNYFTDLLIGTNGKLTGGLGDRFFVLRDFTNGSTQSTAWTTHDSDLIFDGGPAHTFALAGADMGASAAGFTDNFAWKTIRLAAGQSLTLTDGNATPGAALYTRAFILDGGLAQISSIAGNGLTIYYDPADPLSAPLNGQTYALTGGGFLKPIATAALTITSSNFQPDGSLKIDVLGIPNALHHIEASPDLITFTLLGTATADGSGVFSYLDTDADIIRRRYYRVVKP